MARVRIEFPATVAFSCTVPVRISDLNYGNHLGHDTMISLLHEARVQLFEHLGCKEWDVDGAALMVVDLAVSYRAEVFYGQTLVVEIAGDDPGGKSCDLIYRVRDSDSDRLVALAKTRVVFVDPATRKAVALPERVRALAGQGIE